MRPRVFVALFLLLAGLPFGCAQEIRLAPSPEEAARLGTHVERIFAGVAAETVAELEADRERVDHAHRLAYLAEAYNDVAGHYPLASPDSMVFRQTLLGELPNLDTIVENLGDTWVTPEAFLAELRSVLGPEVVLPTDPRPDARGARVYAYGVHGKGYTLAVTLYHPVGWSEGMAPHEWQYRLGSAENLELPVLETRKLLAGGYAETRAPRWRDPSMAEARP